MRTEPCRKSKGHPHVSMLIPEPFTCGDCAHFQRCEAFIGRIAADEYCDWAPSRFAPSVALARKGKEASV